MTSIKTEKMMGARAAIVVENLSRFQLLEWVNNNVVEHVKYASLDELGNGVAYCLMMHNLYPQSLDAKRIKMAPRMQHEYVNNFKLLQEAFTRIKLKKTIPIERLVKCRMQDNLEFIQWFKPFYESHAELEMDIDEIENALGKLKAAVYKKPMKTVPETHEKRHLLKKTAGKDLPVVLSDSEDEDAKGDNIQHSDDEKADLNEIEELENQEQLPTKQQIDLYDKVAELKRQESFIKSEKDFYYRKTVQIEKILRESLAKREHTHFCMRVLKVLCTNKYGGISKTETSKSH